MTDHTLDDVPYADALDALRAEGNAPPRSWGFMRDAERQAHLRALIEQSLACGQPVPTWALRECKRLQIRAV